MFPVASTPGALAGHPLMAGLPVGATPSPATAAMSLLFPMQQLQPMAGASPFNVPFGMPGVSPFSGAIGPNGAAILAGAQSSLSSATDSNLYGFEPNRNRWSMEEDQALTNAVEVRCDSRYCSGLSLLYV